ncbi:Crp/Fnr family transcriptional regulator [Rapidithrix thailandica]|uniref:Crp/Fnr family transcriptional regulator n=1 Tax=Rapidithrix thailandica TaxID=413964 RepID=A0AAW9SCU0_9BACT
MISEELLSEYGASVLTIQKGEYIFRKGDSPRYYFQIKEGAIKMNHYNAHGNEFIQGIFGFKKSFGEPPLINDLPYPANAIALKDSQLIRLPKNRFFDMIHAQQDVLIDIMKSLSERLYYKAIIANSITSQSPEYSILNLLRYLKEEVYQIEGTFTFKVDLTRQQIADLIGLRVETVIRTVKALQQKGTIRIVKRKIYY